MPESLLIVGIRGGPACVHLGLACRLESEAGHSLDEVRKPACVLWIKVGRPGSGQRLVECPLRLRVRHEIAPHVTLEREILLSPSAGRGCPSFRHLAESVEAGAGILSALRI